MFTKKPTDRPEYPGDKKDSKPIPMKVKRDALLKQMKGGC